MPERAVRQTHPACGDRGKGSSLKKLWSTFGLGCLFLGTLWAGETGLAGDLSQARTSLPPAKNFALKDLYSKKISLTEFRGRVVLINFFATWCPPCHQEIPDLVRLYQQHKNKGLVILGVALDAGGEVKELRSFVQKMKIPYPVLIGGEEIAEDYRIFGLPTTVIINPEGRIHRRFNGLVPMDHFERTLQELWRTPS